SVSLPREVSNVAQALNATLIAISEKVKPAVVTVFTEKVMHVQVVNPFFHSPFEDFFQDFFFDHRERRRDPQPRSKEYRQHGMGSGVIVTADGYILTNNHVVADMDTISVKTFDDRTFKAKVIGRDPKTDVAVIKI